MASSKMKQLRQGGSKETDELDNEDNEELFGDIGVYAAFWQTLTCLQCFPTHHCTVFLPFTQLTVIISA